MVAAISLRSPNRRERPTAVEQQRRQESTGMGTIARWNAEDAHPHARMTSRGSVFIS